MIELGIAKVIGEAVTAGFGLVDDLHTSDEEKLVLKQHFLTIQQETFAQALDYESKIIESRANIIIAEASGRWWEPKAVWRPLVMLVFTGLVVAWWFGFQPENADDALMEELFLLIQIGLGGYIVGRSAEKVAKTVVNANAQV